MKTISIVIAVLLLAGCAAPPKVTPPARTKTVLTQRAFDEIAASRARELALYALSYIGTPYRYGGASPDVGFDCSGLVSYVYSRSANVRLPRSTEALSAVGTPVALMELEPGDLVFFDTQRRPYSHVGIYLGDQRFIHAPTSRGQVELVDLRHTYWQRRYNGARRLEL
jgi:cell wall-associated NlpC family hydrolase